MFDNIINSIKGFFPDRFLQFLVAAVVINLIMQLRMGGVDPMSMLHFVVTVLVAGVLASAVIGAAKS